MQDHVLRAGLRTVTLECGCQGISAVLTLPIERRGRGALISDPVSSKATWNQDHDHVKRFRGTVVATNEGLGLRFGFRLLVPVFGNKPFSLRFLLRETKIQNT